MKSLFFVFLSLILASLTLQARAETEVRIGVLLPLTGDVANYGREARNSIEMAVAEINGSNYIPGFRLRLLYEDGQCSSRVALSAARKLITIDKVTGIIAPGCSSEVLAAAPVAEQSQRLLLASFASSPAITHAGDYIFRVCPSDAEGGRATAELVIDDHRQSVVMISENTEYALGVRDVFKATLGRASVELKADETFNSDLNDFRVLLLRLKASSPAALFLNPQSGVKAGLLLRQVRELGWNIPMYGTFAFSSEDARKSVGDIHYLDGLKFTDAPDVSGRRGGELLQRFKKQYGPLQSEFSVAFSYDLVYLFANAIKAVGPHPEKMKDYLYQIESFHGVALDYRFDSNGDVLGVPFTKRVYKDGAIHLIGK